jgi:hypothetical protein
MNAPPTKIGRFGSAKEHKIDDLPDDKKCRDIKSDDVPELDRRQIERRSISHKQTCADQDKREAHDADGIVDR